MGAFLLFVFSQSFSFAADFSGVVGRLPVLVASGRDGVLVRTLSADRRLGFQVCPVEPGALDTERALYASVNGAMACSDVGNQTIDLADTSAVTALEDRYPVALERRLSRIRSRSLVSAVESGVFVGSLAGASLFIANQIKSFPGPGRMVSLSIAGTLGVLSSIESARMIKYSKRSLRERPPTPFEQDVVQLVKARDVTNPDNFAPPLIFRNVVGALATTIEGVNADLVSVAAEKQP